MPPGAPERTPRFVHYHQAWREIDRETVLHQAMLEFHVLHDGKRVVETPDGVEGATCCDQAEAGLEQIRALRLAAGMPVEPAGPMIRYGNWIPALVGRNDDSASESTEPVRANAHGNLGHGHELFVRPGQRIGVDKIEQRTARGPDAGVACGATAKLCTEDIGERTRLDHRGGVVRRAVVHDDDLDQPIRRDRLVPEPVQEAAQRAGVITDRDNHAEDREAGRGDHWLLSTSTRRSVTLAQL